MGLKEILSRLYPSEAGIRTLLRDVSLPEEQFEFHPKAKDTWSSILQILRNDPDSFRRLIDYVTIDHKAYDVELRELSNAFLENDSALGLKPEELEKKLTWQVYLGALVIITLVIISAFLLVKHLWPDDERDSNNQEAITAIGRVIDARTLSRISHARIILNIPNSPVSHTDSEGRFELRYQRNGHVQFELEADGYQRLELNLPVSEVAREFRMTPNEFLTQQNGLAGRVIDDRSSERIAHAMVFADINGGEHTYTDLEGQFRLNHIHSDRNTRLEFTAQGYRNLMQDVRPSDRFLDVRMIRLDEPLISVNDLFRYSYTVDQHSCPGFFGQTGSGEWVEHTPAEPNCISTVYYFSELSRDATWIILHDASRGYFLRLPTQGNGWAQLATSQNGPWTNLHEISLV